MRPLIASLVALTVSLPALAQEEAEPAGGGGSTASAEDPFASGATGEQSSAGTNFLGGRLVDRGTIYATVGYPTLEVGYKAPLGDSVELAPVLTLGYPSGTFGYYPFAGGFGRLRHVAGRRLPHQAGRARRLQRRPAPVRAPAPGLRRRRGRGRRPRAPPAFLGTYRVADVVDLDFGIVFEPDIYFGGWRRRVRRWPADPAGRRGRGRREPHGRRPLRGGPDDLRRRWCRGRRLGPRAPPARRVLHLLTVEHVEVGAALGGEGDQRGEADELVGREALVGLIGEQGGRGPVRAGSIRERQAGGGRPEDRLNRGVQVAAEGEGHPGRRAGGTAAPRPTAPRDPGWSDRSVRCRGRPAGAR